MWSRIADSSAAIRSTSSSVSSQARQPRDVEDLLAVDHRRAILGERTAACRARCAAARTGATSGTYRGARLRRQRRQARDDGRRSGHAPDAEPARGRRSSPPRASRRRRRSDAALAQRGPPPSDGRVTTHAERRRRRSIERRGSAPAAPTDRAARDHAPRGRAGGQRSRQHARQRRSTTSDDQDVVERVPRCAGAGEVRRARRRRRRTSRGTATAEQARARAIPRATPTSAEAAAGLTAGQPTCSLQLARPAACCAAGRRSSSGPTPPGTGVIARGDLGDRVEVDVAARGRRRCGSCRRR